MPGPQLISLIISTYNWPDALDATLRALSKQTKPGHFEVIIADDGSKPDTAQLIQTWQQKAHFEINHAWQADQGFRAARSRNNALLKAAGDYIIFLDGDCIPRRSFIANHRHLARQQHFVAGNRVLLDEAFTQQHLSVKTDLSQKSWWFWLKTRLQGHCNRCLALLTLPLGPLRDYQPKRWQGARTCNLAAWTKDLFTINGFDQHYEGWGYEDTDLVLRLMRIGCRRRSGRFATSVLHCFHQLVERKNTEKNLQRLHELQNNDHIQAIHGLEQLQNENKYIN